MRTAAAAVAAALAPAVWLAWRLRRRYIVVTVAGGSMEPTFASGDLLLARRRTGAATAGDVVVVDIDPRIDAGPGKPALIVKRVAAAAGDPVPRRDVPVLALVPETVVPAGKIVLLGDNPASTDSRQYGYVGAERITAVVTRRLLSRPSRTGGRG